MKTERRHELQNNTLAEMLNEAGENAKPYAKGILGVLIAALVIFGIYMYLSRQAAAESAASWEQMFQALGGNDGKTTLDELRATANANPSKPAGVWARLLLADSEFSVGIQQLFTERSVAKKSIGDALEDYRQALDHARDQLVRQRALLGVAKASESLDKLDDAREAYQKLIKEFPGGPYEQQAKQRLEQLTQTSTKEWYDWFRNAEPAPNVFGKGKGPASEKSIFDTPDLKLPDVPKQDSHTPETVKPPKTDGEKTDTAKTDAAKTDATKTDPDKTDSGKPDAKKPAAEKAEPAKSEASSKTPPTDNRAPASDEKESSKKDAAPPPPGDVKPAAPANTGAESKAAK